jgi:hypothetical protein
MTKARPLNQIIAIEKGVKTRVYTTVTELHKSTQKPELLTGFSKSYYPMMDDGQKYPDEQKQVQVIISQVLPIVAQLMTEWFDVSATRDYGNTIACADVIVEGRTLIERAPVPFLLFLEKQLSDMNAFVGKMVELDTSHTFTINAHSGLYQSEPSSTLRTEKVEDFQVVVQPTKEHPAQIVKVVKDRPVGTWKTINSSGAIPATVKRGILDRIETLVDAVKQARERANMTEVQDKVIGKAIFSYLFEQPKNA